MFFFVTGINVGRKRGKDIYVLTLVQQVTGKLICSIIYASICAIIYAIVVVLCLMMPVVASYQQVKFKVATIAFLARVRLATSAKRNPSHLQQLHFSLAYGLQHYGYIDLMATTYIAFLARVRLATRCYDCFRIKDTIAFLARVRLATTAKQLTYMPPRLHFSLAYGLQQ